MNEELCVPTQATEAPRGIGESARPKLTKQRFVELTQLGLTCSQKLIENGLKPNEYCEFGRIMDRLMQLD
jgi:hypothetical protein